MTDFKPMLAKAPKDDGALPFPVLVQPKLDGIRATVVNGKLVSRTLKPIPNAEIRAALERPVFEGLDGELVVGDQKAENSFQVATSFVMSESKIGQDWTFYVFDKWDHPGTNIERQAWLDENADDLAADNLRVQVVSTTEANDALTLASIEATYLEHGLEGVIARDPNARYKFGRSSPIKGPLWKIKRFIDFEAEVVGVYEKMHNDNPAMTNALGRTERSTAKAGKRAAGTLGGLELVAINGPAEGIEFRCGTGFDDEQRADLWAIAHDPDRPFAQNGLLNAEAGECLNGRSAKIKSFPIGVKDKPRFPVFLGWRNMEIDG